MTIEQFQKLIARTESPTLDFKEDGYDLQDNIGRGNFIKDLLAMANTPRDSSAYIILGVRWTPESGSTVVGMKHQFDDADFQDKLGYDRVQPNPCFNYYPLNVDGNQVGILEIPVIKRGPYTPIKDFPSLSLHLGAVYYRRGTTNSRAFGIDLKGIHDWFSDREYTMDEQEIGGNWSQFVDAVHTFEPERNYILAADRISSQATTSLHALGIPPWRAVIDFDPKSDVSGFLRAVKDTLGQHRVIHQIVRDNYRVQPEPGTHWFFARGLSGRQDTLVDDDSHRSWLKTYKRELGKQLEHLANTINHPVVALILWSDHNLRGYLGTLIEELFGAFSDNIEIVVVSDDESSFSGLVEDLGATFMKISLRSLCNGLVVHYADQGNADKERCILTTSSGAPIEIRLDDWLWLSEDIELIHRSVGLDGDDNPKEYRLGADISWRNLHLRHDCERDITPAVRSQVETDLKKRQTVRINLYHEPGSGGTTVGHRLAWELRTKFPVGILRNCVPRETAERIGKISTLTENSVLIIADGGRHSERDIDDLYELLMANQTPVVLIQILRRFQRHQSHMKGPKRQFWLDAKLSDMEADRFHHVYEQAVPTKREALSKLANQRNNPHRTAFFFGLTAFEMNFRGIPQYVKERVAEVTDEQERILVYISIAYYYGQQSIPAQAFSSLLGIPRLRTFDLREAFSAEGAAPALDLLIGSKERTWRVTHPLVAREIMKQILAPRGSPNPEAVWLQNLSSWGKDFASFCCRDTRTTSDRFLELVRRVFIYRDNAEILGTERADRRQFAQLIDDIPSPLGKREVLRHLIDQFPSEAHFYAHLGRFLSLNGEYDEALQCVDSAISLQSGDHVLHHMRGMVLRRKMKACTILADQLIDAAKASESFEAARQLSPDLEHGYISEVQMLIELIDKVGQKRQDIHNVLARPEVNPFLQQALEKAEELLDRVQHLHAGEKFSLYAADCRARLQRIYGDYKTALQAWDNLLSRPEISKPPIRRQIVWTILRRKNGVWDQLTLKETDRVRHLMEENLEEEVNDSKSLRLWLRAIRQLQSPPTLDSIIEKVAYWKVNTGVLDAVYYLYVLHILHALNGSRQSASDAEKALEECRRLAQFRRDRRRSFEWIGPGDGIETLVHQSRLGEWRDDFWSSTDALYRLQGRIKDIGGPQRGHIELDCGIDAFFVPGKSSPGKPSFHSSRDENALVDFYLGFSYDGPRAWDVQRIET